MISDVHTPSRDTIKSLRAMGMTREEIAALYGVNLARVKRWIRDMDIPPAKRRKSDKISSSDADLGTDHGMTLIDKAKRALGHRMGQDYRGYLLDGRPVRVDFLIQAAGLTVPNTH